MKRRALRTILLAITVSVITGDCFAQANDNCMEAVTLSLGSQCSTRNFSTENATAEPASVAPDPGCASYVGGDIWFKFAMPATGRLRIEVDNLNGATPPSFALYTGTCGSFLEVTCLANDKTKTLSLPDLANDTLYLRVYRFFSAATIDFSLCIFEAPVPSNDLCENAGRIDVGQSCNVTVYSNAYATAQMDDIAPDPSCGFYKGGDIWFKTTMPPSGTLRITKSRITGAANPSMTLYTGTCGTFTELFCSANVENETFVNPMLSGEELFIRLHSFNNEEGYTFSLCIFEQGNPPNDDCEMATQLVIGPSCEWVDGTTFLADNQPPTVAANPSCGSFEGSDIWYTFSVPVSGRFTLNLQSVNSTVPPSFALYAGVCGDFTELVCADNKTRYPFDLPSRAGELLYMRVYPFHSKDGGPFSICGYEAEIVLSNEDANLEATLFPNPVSGMLQVGIPSGSSGARFELTDLMGRTLHRGLFLSEDIHQIDMSGQRAGAYLLKLSRGEEIVTFKVWKN